MAVTPPRAEPSGYVTGPEGLTTADVAQRVERGQTNESGERTSRTLGEIVRANVLTRFNAILGTMFVLILVFGSPADGLFGIILVSNALIGIVQEYRAKRTLDRLAVLSAPRARVVRDGAVTEVAIEAIVLDDLVELRTGDQVPADGLVQEADGLELDESLLTGESDPVLKAPGDQVLSGAIVVAGDGRFQATAVGADAYARQLAAEARRFTLTQSELVDGIDRILRFVTWLLVAVVPLLFWRELQDQDLTDAVTGAVSGVVGMIPQGLVLLTSISFGLAAVTLARRRVLVQELPAVEGLARVDVVCLDKTGTLTEGIVEFERVEHLDPTTDDAEVEAALGAITHDEGGNATQDAIAAAFPAPDWARDGRVPFSSARKWSAASFGGHGAWVLGAPEMVVLDGAAPARAQANDLAATGRRVLVLARADALAGEELPASLRPVALVLLEEKVRPTAPDTLRYFREQGVHLKVISGDNPRTVGAVAKRVGLEDGAEPVDARDLPEDVDDLAEVLETHSVFGRVTPHQKRAMVKALQSRGHVVAMTGDGVNDALALKDADIGVAMGSGAAATRAVAQLVLIDSEFATMPGVVAEGRRVIANIERVSNLFLTKTTYAALLAITITILLGWPYPILPRQFTIVDALTIGIPGFFLALAPNTRRYLPGFLARVVRFTTPAGIVVAAAVTTGYAIARAEDAGTIEARTTATIILMVLGLYVLGMLARPFTRYRAVLLLAMIGLFVGALVVPFVREFFKLEIPDNTVLFSGLAVAAVGCVALELAVRAVRRWFDGREAATTTSPAS